MSIRIHWKPVDTRSLTEFAERTRGQPPIAYQQHPAYGLALRGYASQALQADIFHHDQLIGYVQCQTRRLRRVLPLSLAMRGVVWLTEPDEAIKAESYRQLRSTCPLRRPRIMLWMPERDDHAALHKAGMRRVISSYSTIMLDLTQSEDTLLAAMDGKWRNQLRSAQKSVLACISVGLKPEQYRWLLECETEQSRRIGYTALTPSLVYAYQTYAGANSLLILRADIGKDTVAGVLCLIHGETATYHIGWNNPQGRELAAHNLLVWECIRKLKARGIRWFDLGGLNTENGAGLARFKLGTGGALYSIPGVYW